MSVLDGGVAEDPVTTRFCVRKKEELVVAAWNCRTMLQLGAEELIASSLSARGVDVACLSEVRLKGEGSKWLQPAKKIDERRARAIAEVDPTFKWPCITCYKNCPKGAIGCTRCGWWYHYGCIGMQHQEAKAVYKTWVCQICNAEERLNAALAVPGYNLYWSGSGPTDKAGQAGVAIAVNKRLADSVMFWEARGPRVMRMRIKTKPFNLSIVAVYAPTDVATEAVKDEFYDEVASCLRLIPKSDYVIVAGDWNAKVGPRLRSEHATLGPFGIGQRNDNGDRFVSLVSHFNLFVANTAFKHKKSHVQTWRSPDDRVHNQIDYVLVRQRWKSSVMDARAFWGNLWKSDHAVLKARIRFRFGTDKKPVVSRRYNVERLKDPDVSAAYSAAVGDGLDPARRFTSLDERWGYLKEKVTKAAEEVLGHRKYRPNRWISNHTIQLTEKRRNLCSGGKDRELNREVKAAVKMDKHNYWNDVASQMEHATKVGDSKRLYQLINSAKGGGGGVSDTLQDSTGAVIEGAEEKVVRWEEHFSQLLNRPPPVNPLKEEDLPFSGFVNLSEEVPSRDEILKAIKSARSGKAPGEDGIPPELWKHAGEVAIDCIEGLFREVWETEKIPSGWKEAEILPLFKKGNKADCKNYRGISLIDIALKILESVIMARIKPYRDYSTRENQAGFRSGRGCVDQVFALRYMLESRKEFGKKTYLAFVDFSAAFDSVDRKALWDIMLADGVPLKLVSILRAVYEETLCKVRVYQTHTQVFAVKTGVRQGAISSPPLFNWVVDSVMDESIDDQPGGVLLANSKVVTDLTFADDIALTAETIPELQGMLDRLAESAARVGLVISSEKTKSMCVGATQEVVNVSVYGRPIEQVEKFRYLGSEISCDANSSVDVKSRLGKAAGAMNNLNHVWQNHGISIKTKARVYMASVRSVLTYGCETWAVKKTDTKKLEAFEHRAWRRMLGISYLDRIRNTEVARRMGIEELLGTVIQRKRLTWFGHVARMPDDRIPKQVMLHSVLPGWVRQPGGTCKTWRQRLFDDINIPRLRNEQNRNWQGWIANWMQFLVVKAQNRALFGKMVAEICAA